MPLGDFAACRTCLMQGWLTNASLITLQTSGFQQREVRQSHVADDFRLDIRPYPVGLRCRLDLFSSDLEARVIRDRAAPTAPGGNAAPRQSRPVRWRSPPLANRPGLNWGISREPKPAKRRRPSFWADGMAVLVSGGNWATTVVYQISISASSSTPRCSSTCWRTC